MKTEKLRVLLVLPLLLVSCLTARRMTSVPVTLGEVRVQDIEEALANGETLKAIQDVDTLSRAAQPPVSPAVLSDLRSQAVDDLVADTREALQAGDYSKAWPLYLGVVALAEQDRLGHWSTATLVLAMTEDLISRGESVRALLVFARSLAELDLPRDRVERIARQLSELGYGRSVDALLNRTDSSGGTTEEMLRGTATIWVDKGLKIEGGVGYPDRAMGSGFFVDRSGRLVTNYHVVRTEVDPEYEGYSRLYVRLPGRPDEKLPAKVVAWDPILDVAIVQAQVTPGYIFSLVADPKASPGQEVLAIGSPVDPLLENTITSGIVSAVGRRRLVQIGDVIQIDAAVNPGNSGGPLVNEKGELLGIVFAGIKPFEGLNFAIPIGWVSRIYPRLAEGGKIAHPWLGTALLETEDGLQVTYSVPGEPAARGGIKAGDILEEIDGRAFRKIRDAQRYLIGLPQGTLVRLKWRRQEVEGEGLFYLGVRPDSPIEKALQVDSRMNVIVPLFGMRLKRAGNVLWETEYVTEQVIPGSVADNTGISEGDAVNLQDWQIDTENRYAVLQIFVKKRKAGYLERVISLAAYLDPDNFL